MKNFSDYTMYLPLILTQTTVAKDTFVRMNLPLSKLRGQCYKGASTMRGARSGVATRICEEEPRAVYTHCYGHSINLAASDAVKESKLMRDALDTIYEITKLIKYSPRREAIFFNLKQESDTSTGNPSPGIRVLCPTRWTVRANSLASIVSNYSALQSTWEEAVDLVRDSETKARINGVSAQMRKFDFLLGTLLGEMLLQHTDNLNRTLQKTMSAAEGQQVGRMVIDTLAAVRTQTSFDLFWEKVAKFVESTDVEEPHIPRQHGTPKRFDPGSSSGDFHTSPKLYHRQLYYGAVDNVINCLKDRFNQPGYRLYCNLEQLLLKACQQKAFEDEFQVICSFNKEDFYPDILRAQLLTFGINFAAYNKAHEAQHAPTIFGIWAYFRSLSVGQRDLLHHVVRVMKLILVMPATNASSERSFSAL